MNELDKVFMELAIEHAKNGMSTKSGGPFGAIVVKDNEIVGRGHNRVATENDPTAHAEVVAIRDACKNLGTFQLTGCTLYTTCEPCPMCLGAIYWSRPDKVFYGSTKEDAAQAGFDDFFIYMELELPHGERKIPFKPFLRDKTLELFQIWDAMPDKIEY